MIALATTPVVLIVATPMTMILGATWLAHKTRGMPVPKNAVAWTIMIFAVVFSSISGIVGFVLYDSQKRDYSDCVNSVTRSAGNHAQHLSIIVRLRDRGLAEDADVLEDDLGVNLPARKLSECDELKP